MALALLLPAGQARADFKVEKMTPQILGASLELSGRLELGMGAKVEEALNKGIPMDIIIALSLYRKRNIVWDQTIAHWALTRRISYHALSGQYLVTLDARKPDEIESHTSLREALNSMGALTEIKLPLPGGTGASDDYYLDLRVNLDIESLPAPLRPVAYTSFAWRLNSGWSTWKVQR